MVLVQSPNHKVRPTSATINQQDHLVLGGCDTVELAEKFGTPLWIMDEQTILSAISAYKQGLAGYPDSLVLYAGKAFLCLAMCHLIKQQGLGLDVVSEGELHTAIEASFPADKIFMHGNNKTEAEIGRALEYGDIKIVVDNESELHMVASIAQSMATTAQILMRIIPDVEPDTHQHIITGHAESKFGIALEDLHGMIKKAQSLAPHVKLLGLHAHIGSQAQVVEPYFKYVDVLAKTHSDIKKQLGIEFPWLDIGGGLGIAYTESDEPAAINEWTQGIAARVMSTFQAHGLKLPKLMVEPGRSIVGTAGVTLYRAGHKKTLPSGIKYISVDGGMADNPRPITYDAKYTACVANRMTAAPVADPVILAGKYCESGDIIIKETFLPAETGDLIAVFGTGAYNYSMASNYNRTGRPACVLVSGGNADVIVERESNDDLLRHDRVPKRLLR